MTEAVDTPVKIVDFARLSLFTPTPGVEGQRSRLSFGTRDGNPRITVFTNDPRDTINKGILIAAMNPETFKAFCLLFKQVCESQGEIKHYVECYGSRWENNVKVENRVLTSTIWFGKDSDGIIWISIVADGRPKIRFNFKMSDWHNIYMNGVQIDEATASKLEALSKLDLVETLVKDQIVKTAEHRTIRGPQNTNPQQKGGFQNQQQKQAPAPAEQKKPEPAFEDFDF